MWVCVILNRPDSLKIQIKKNKKDDDIPHTGLVSTELNSLLEIRFKYKKRQFSMKAKLKNNVLVSTVPYFSVKAA